MFFKSEIQILNVEMEKLISLNSMNNITWSFFDMDNTILKGQSQSLFIKFLFKKKVIKFNSWIKILILWTFYKVKILEAHRVAVETFRYFKGRNVEDFEQIFKDFFELYLRRKLFSYFIKLIENHKERGINIAIISNSLEPIVKLVSGYLQIKFYIATNLVAKNGVYTGNFLSNYGGDKLRRFMEFVQTQNISLRNSVYYTDSVADLPILEKVSYPVVVNPDRKLFKLAKERNFKILKIN